jgi:hypothetical protein
MKIPNFIYEKALDENGYWTKPWQSLWEQLFLNMQNDLSDEGFVMPSQNDTNILLLTQMRNGTIIYDSTNDEFKGKVGGIVKTFTLT